MTATSTDANPIRLKKNTIIGELDAESDHKLLTDCFLESEDFKAVKSCNDSKSVIVGRVGAGKSALLFGLKEACGNSVWLDPHGLSFQYIENSSILQFVESIGVNLNTFYKLLWRHVLVVELLKARFQITDIKKQKSFLETVERIFSVNESKRKALDYLREWGDKFWEETEIRVKEVTSKIESQLGASLGADFAPGKLGATAAQTLSQEQKAEISNRAKRVVNEIQIKKLSEVLELLAEDELLGNEQRKFYILIDSLDSNWATTDTRCRLIRALIEEIKTFRQLASVKIAIALRRDLLSLVYDKTRDSGFQEEKYEALLLELKWSDNELRRLVDSRIATVFERQYSRSRVNFDDIFQSPKSGGELPFNYILDRTLKRPRDVIQFVNESLKIAADKSRVSINDLKKAENIYSEKRLNSLYEEWSEIYPALRTTIEILRNAPQQLSRSHFKNEPLQTVLPSLLGASEADPCVAIAMRYTEPKSRVSESDVLVRILQCLYQVGAIGIKPDSNDTFCWSWKDQPTMSDGEVKRSSHIRIHKMLWQALNVSQHQN